MPLLFATSNKGKFEEARAFLAPRGVDLQQRAIPHPEIQADTLEEVARERALWLKDKLFGQRFFVDDAGLFVEALGGFPGVYSAYAFRTLGCDGILRLLEGRETRAARFEAVIAYMEPSLTTPVLLKGVCKGSIATAPRGGHGFGFDPIFSPEGASKTFAELSLAEKNPISHRGKALARFAEWLARNAPSDDKP